MFRLLAQIFVIVIIIVVIVIIIVVIAVIISAATSRCTGVVVHHHHGCPRARIEVRPLLPRLRPVVPAERVAHVAGEEGGHALGPEVGDAVLPVARQDDGVGKDDAPTPRQYAALQVTQDVATRGPVVGEVAERLHDLVPSLAVGTAPHNARVAVEFLKVLDEGLDEKMLAGDLTRPAHPDLGMLQDDRLMDDSFGIECIDDLLKKE